MKFVHYNNLGYSTFFNPSSGFFIRAEHKGHSEPFMAPAPELIDISITNWCDLECDFCYRSSTKDGLHMQLLDYQKIIEQAAKLRVYQVALGGGNPNQHPQFCEILEMTRDQYDIVPNYTTNGRGLTSKVLEATKKHCGAIALSVTSCGLDIEKNLERLCSYGIKTNLHYVLSKKTINTAIDWLKNPPAFLSKTNAIIFLNYKPVNYNSEHKALIHSKALNIFFELTKTKLPFKIGFDSCMVSNLSTFYSHESMCIEGCDAARFSMYINEKLEAYPCSFMEPMCNGEKLSDWESLKKLWDESPTFKKIRNHFSSNECSQCSWQHICKNGCPIFDEINICKSHIKLK